VAPTRRTSWTGLGALFMLLLAGAVTPGCLALAGGAVAAGGVAYAMGDLEAEVDASVRKTHKAALEALDDMDLKVESAQVSEVDSEIVARTAQGRHVRIQIDARGAKGCELSIRVGTFGDEPLSRRIYEKIRDEL
jgi:Protein of unknown function (DUF3568)